ncbi:hypothetical protein EVAR_12782_1 [Eumeta japonica]|uniref:Uncharacterized protein n=1 Tax=Eumeta variegata TaxID=151549 RepID=A0A4C1UC33_EUMVA|nr:hypothetical protein EVAR_12782_1 [Eumeta japonica]
MSHVLYADKYFPIQPPTTYPGLSVAAGAGVALSGVISATAHLAISTSPTPVAEEVWWPPDLTQFRGRRPSIRLYILGC